MKKVWCLFFLCAWLCASLGVHARDQLVVVPTREGAHISYWWMPAEGATATVLLLSGGSGGMGLKEGRPQSNNFLIRSSALFRAEGLNVALLGNPTDKRELDDVWRTSEMHREDVANVLQDVRARSAWAPVWLVGTSRGSISAAALGIGMPTHWAGLVLSSSVASAQVPAAVQKQALERIQVPVLVYHHRDDACHITQAADTESIMEGLKHAPIKKRWIVEGGGQPTGNPCKALHWHGFVGMEARAVKDVTGWIKQPTP